jgi:hypothetical protein
VTRPVLTWLALWLGIASAVAVGIVAGFLILRLAIPNVAIAASRPVAHPTASIDVSRSASAVRLPGASLPATRQVGEGTEALPWPRPGDLEPGSPASVRARPTLDRSRWQLVPIPPSEANSGAPSIVLAARSGTRVAGTASWWASFGPGIYAALPGYVAGTRVTIRVWSGELHVDAPVITSCQCFVGTPDERIVDLSPGILAALGLDPGRGLYPVAIEVLP